ncbi:MAG: Pentapeptide repeat family protein, partial [Myxococcaceae bacterium]|nr:Pentapeptide repeat family protein [Myxococcaceae bacterium]
MAELTPDAVVSKVKRGEKIDRADLSGIILANAVLEGAS